MKKSLIHAAVLLVIFFGAVYGFSSYFDQQAGNTSEAMSSASLPLIYMLDDGTPYNCLHGYKQEMNVTATRDTLTVLNSDGTLDIQISPYGNTIGDITFEILSSDGTKSQENTKVSQVTVNGSYVNAVIQPQNKILINTEYVLKIRIMLDGTPVYYYTRIISEDNLHMTEYLDFVIGFYEKCITGSDLDTLATYIEPDANASNSTLAHVDITSSMNQLTWADLDAQIYYKPTPSIKEINGTTATVRMDYMITAKDSDGKSEYYQVSEYYRMRFSTDRILLLDFERDTSQMFDPSAAVLTGKGINLGINNSDAVEYKNDVNGRYFAFSMNGTLWLYDTSAKRMTEVFSFPEGFGEDPRDTYTQNDIQIINIDESGNMYFLICGYMNRGEHEGETGVAVYYFNSAVSSVEESLFVDTKQNYELLRNDAGTLSYISSDRNRFYILVDSSIYSIQLDTRQISTVAENVRADCFVASKSGRYFAWLQENQPYDSSVLTVIDFDTQAMRQITCADTERIRPLSFMDEDLIYGIADAADIDREHEGSELFPMKTVYIENGDGETVKTYSSSGYYVTDAEISGNLITLSRMKKNLTEFEEASDDQIVSSTTDAETAYGFTTQTNGRKQTELILRVGSSLTAGKVSQIVYSKQVIYEGSKIAVLEAKDSGQTRYYVYSKGNLDSVYTTISEAVKAADEKKGVVVNKSWQNIWERGNKDTEKRLNIGEFPSLVTLGTLDVSQWENTFGDNLLDLSGCTLDEVLYYVSEGTPIVAKTPVTEEFPAGVVIIAGYDAYNTILLQPGGIETFYYGLNDSTALFEEAGNIFLTYWDPISE